MNGRFYLLDVDESHVEIVSLVNEIEQESDRGAVIISAAVLEETLGSLIRAFFQNTGGGNSLLASSAALGSFGARADLCCALGAISSEERRALRLIQKIRNEFAHVRTTSFKRQDIADRCAAFKYAPFVGGVLDVPPRDLFLANALLLLLELNGRPEALKLMFSERDIGVRRTYEAYTPGSGNQAS